MFFNGCAYCGSKGRKRLMTPEAYAELITLSKDSAPILSQKSALLILLMQFIQLIGS